MKILQQAVAGLTMSFLLAGCSQWSWSSIPGVSLLKPYSLNFEQGTVIDSEMVGRLKEGMTRAQVAFALGSPLLQDPFHKDRWDYVYYVREEGKLSPPHNLKVFFKDDKLVRYETDYELDKPEAKAPEGAKSVPAVAGSAAPAVTGGAVTPTEPQPVNGPDLDTGAPVPVPGGAGGVLDDGSKKP